MANPQLEDGFIMISSEIVDVLAQLNLNGTEMRILLCIFRYTYGFHRKSHPLSASFVARYVKGDLRTVKRALKHLQEMNIVTCINPTEKCVTKELMFNKDYNSWNADIQVSDSDKMPTIDEIQASDKMPTIDEMQASDKMPTKVVGKIVKTSDKMPTQDNINKKYKSKNKYIVEQSPTSDVFREVIDYLNQRTGKHFRQENKTTRRHINARIKDGYCLEDFKRVIDLKAGEWMGTEMEKYLRPETLFAGKFEGYLNSCPAAVQKKIAPAQEEDEQPIDHSNYEREW